MVNADRVKCVARVSQAITQYTPVPDPPSFSLKGTEMSSSMMMMATWVKESICNEDGRMKRRMRMMRSRSEGRRGLVSLENSYRLVPVFITFRCQIGPGITRSEADKV